MSDVTLVADRDVLICWSFLLLSILPLLHPSLEAFARELNQTESLPTFLWLPCSPFRSSEPRFSSLLVLTFASFFCLFTAVVGLCGTLLNNRAILAFYNVLLWPALLSICFVGYTSYKREDRKLDRKLNQAWSQFYDDLE
jgi:hypothetical protein